MKVGGSERKTGETRRSKVREGGRDAGRKGGYEEGKREGREGTTEEDGFIWMSEGND